METFELFQRMSAALAIGLLIGLERGWKEREDQEGMRSAGFRTHALAGLLGASWGAIALRPSRSNRQYASRSGAPGSRTAMPTIEIGS